MTKKQIATNIIACILIVLAGLFLICIIIKYLDSQTPPQTETQIIDDDPHGFTHGWVKYNPNGNPILGDANTGSLFDVNVIKDYDGLYRMYLSWRDKKAIAVTTSEDGFNWSDLRIVLESDPTTGWEDDVNRSSVVMKDDRYYMWYTGQSNGVSKIGYATSEDGYVWQKYGRPILEPEYEFEQSSTMNPFVMYDEGIYKMYYAGGEIIEPDVLAYATSEDGIHWQKYEGNPILTKNPDPEALDSYKVGGCEVLKNSDGTYTMFYIGYTDLNTGRIFVADSADGINWTRHSQPIVTPSQGEFDSNSTYKPSVIYDDNTDRYLLYYNGRTSIREYIGLYYKEADS